MDEEQRAVESTREGWRRFDVLSGHDDVQWETRGTIRDRVVTAYRVTPVYPRAPVERTWDPLDWIGIALASALILLVLWMAVTQAASTY